MRIVCAFAVALVGSSNWVLAQAPPAGPIVWQLENPFRYFKKAEDTEAHRREFLALKSEEKSEPVLSTERRLAAKDSRRGWADAVFERVMDEGCWYSHPKEQAAGKGKSSGPCGAYLKPKSHAIKLSAPTISGACTWRVAGQIIPSNDCSKPSKPATVPYGIKSEVVLSTPGKAVAAKDTIEVDDILVVGLGDSFGAGEGNPDRPVKFTRAAWMDYEAALTGYPQRAGLKPQATYEDPDFANKGAGWVHRRCHRSLYSHQLRVALQLAVEDPALHRSVTFVGLACTGATILDLFNVYGGRAESPSSADEPHSRRKHELSQLSILSHLLCEPNAAKLDEETDYNVNQRLELDKNSEARVINIYKCDPGKRVRNVDLLLLSVGGNDVGFSGLVANAALNDKGMLLPELFEEDPRIEPEEAEAYLRRLPGRYQALSEALVAVLDKDASGRVVLTAYPQMGADEERKPCQSSNRGLDVTDVWLLNKGVIAETEAFVDKHLTPAMADAAKLAGWVFAKEPRTDEKFGPHGICAASAAEKAVPALSNDRFPRRVYTGDPSWKPYKPDEFRPYNTRQRWFRTPNDAFLTAHFHDNDRKLPNLRVTRWSAYSGAFHPTAEGQAAIADSVMEAARKIVDARIRSTP